MLLTPEIESLSNLVGYPVRQTLCGSNPNFYAIITNDGEKTIVIPTDWEQLETEFFKSILFHEAGHLYHGHGKIRFDRRLKRLQGKIKISLTIWTEFQADEYMAKMVGRKLAKKTIMDSIQWYIKTRTPISRQEITHIKVVMFIRWVALINPNKRWKKAVLCVVENPDKPWKKAILWAIGFLA